MSDVHAEALSRLKKSVKKVESSQAERDRLILEAVQSNVPVQKIAGAVGLSRARIYQIVGSRSS